MSNRVTYFTSLLVLFFLNGLISRIYWLLYDSWFLCFCVLNSIDYLYRLLICCEDVELNPGPARSCHMGRVLFSNIRGLYKNFKDLIATCHHLRWNAGFWLSSWRWVEHSWVLSAIAHSWWLDQPWTWYVYSHPRRFLGSQEDKVWMWLSRIRCGPFLRSISEFVHSSVRIEILIATIPFTIVC